MTSEIIPHDADADNICHHLFPVSDAKTYLMSLKKVLTQIKENFDLLNETNLVKTLVQVYFDCGPKYSAKRVLASFLQNTPASPAERIQKCLENQLIDEIDTCQQHLTDFSGEECLKETRIQALNFLSLALEVFVKTSHKKMSPLERNEVMHHCLATIKTSNRLIQKCFPETSASLSKDEKIHNMTVRFLNSGLQILLQDDFLTDCRCGVGMVIVLMLKLSVGANYIHIILKSVFLTDLHEISGQSLTVLPYLDAVDLSVLSSDDLSLTSTICLYFGLLPMIDTTDLVRPLMDSGWILTSIFLNRLLNLTNRCSDTGSKVLLAKTITLWTNRTCAILECGECPSDLASSLTGEGHVISGILGYVWTTWDDQLDVLRQNAKCAFENCIKIHRLASKCDHQQDVFLRQSTQNLLDVTWTNKGKYGCLGSLISHAGAALLLELNPKIAEDILTQMEEQALACYASDLYEKLFRTHYSEVMDRNPLQKNMDMTTWLTRWVEPIIQALCGVNKKLKLHIIEYVLPKLLKFSRECLNYMIKTLSNKAEAPQGQTGALVMCIRRARALGLLNTPETSHTGSGGDDGLWYGLVSPEILKYALTCADEQVRLDAFALLCENMKTTEPISELELSLLQYFLPFNLNNQSPAFRQYLLAYLHKLLVRLKESGATHIRLARKNKHPAESQTDILLPYKKFLTWLQSQLFGGLYPGSAFARRLTCLAGLVLLTQVFSGQDGQNIYCFHSEIDSTHINTLLECLTDTFEENKMAAVTVLTYLFKQGSNLQTKSQVECLFLAAMALSCSTKPHDCTTASYIFKVLLHQPIISEVMRSYVTDLKIQMTNEERAVIMSGPADVGIDTNPEMMLMAILLLSLKDQTRVANKSLIIAAANRPMYPTMHCIRYILSSVDWRHIPEQSRNQWKFFINSLINACLDVARVVSPVVQDSSPEGNVPTESIMGPGLNVDAVVQTDDDRHWMLEAAESQKTVTLMPEYLVVCCWRSIKEVSLILGQICLDVSVRHSGMVSYEQLLSVGGYFTTQLLESKHRGAFELAYAGFVKMCEMLWRSVSIDLHGLPSQWLEEVMSDIISDDPSSRLCATRRSAGVPFYVQALVTTEPVSTGRACFKSAITRLLELALEQRGGTQVHNPQVHSLNILRALFRDTRLGEDVVPYVADGLKAAILGFKSQVWAVRNSSTLLLSALMTRIFGVKRSKDESAMSKKNCQTGRAFFHRYPSLYQFLLSELTAATQDIECLEKLHLHPSLYPVLMVLGRLFPSSLEGADTHLSLAAFIPFVLKCASSPVFKTRLMAARALQPLANKDQLTSLLLQLVAKLPAKSGSQMRQSYIHGILLQMEHLLALLPTMKSSVMDEVVSALLPIWRNVCWLISRENSCVATRKVALDITNCLLTNMKIHQTSCALSHEFKTVLVQELFDQRHYSSHTPALTEFSTTVSDLCLNYLTGQSQNTNKEDTHKDSSSSEKHGHDLSQETVVLLLLGSEMYEVRLSVLEVLMQSFSHVTLRWCPRMDGEMDEYGRETVNVIKRLEKSEEVYKKLLEMAFSERHHECLALVYEVLSVHPSTALFTGKTDLRETFQRVLRKLQSETRDELKAAMLKFSSVLLPIFYSGTTESPEESVCTLVQDWCRVLQECCTTEQSADLQLTCAAIFKHNAQFLLLDPHHILNSVVFDLWRAVFDLLQEDDLEVKDTAAQILSSLERDNPNNDLQATVIVEKLLTLMTDHFGQRNFLGCVTTLTSWIIENSEEEQIEGVRLFDKGEMNTYRESVAFVDLCQYQLNRLLTGTLSRETTHPWRTNSVESFLTSVLETQAEKIAALTPLDGKCLFVDTSSYHCSYETIYRTCALVRCVKTVTNSEQHQNLCDAINTVVDKKLGDHFSNYRLNKLIHS